VNTGEGEAGETLGRFGVEGRGAIGGCEHQGGGCEQRKHAEF
jgi:hypothetical protein